MSTLLEDKVRSEVTGLGTRLRDLRTQHGWTLDELARRTTLSKSYLSRLEEGGRQPSIAALLSLAQAFDLTLAALFETEHPEKHATVTRAGTMPLRQGNGLSYASLSQRGEAGSMQPIFVTVPADRSGDEQYRHDGEEWLYILDGTLRLILAEDTYDLSAGDAAHFDARVPHRLEALGTQDVQLILVACAAPKELLHSYR